MVESISPSERRLAAQNNNRIMKTRLVLLKIAAENKCVAFFCFSNVRLQARAACGASSCKPLLAGNA